MKKKMATSTLLLAILLLSPIAAAVNTFNYNATTDPTLNLESISTTTTKGKGADLGTQGVEPGGTLKFPLEETPNSLNPLQTTASYDMQIFSHIFQTLMGGNPNEPFNQDIESYPPAIAKNVSETTVHDYTVTLPSKGGKQVTLENATIYTYTLNQGYYFQDGTEVTADDVVFSANLIKWIDVNDAGNVYTDTMRNGKWIKTVKLSRYKVRTILNTTSFIPQLYARDFTIFPSHIYGDADTWEDEKGEDFSGTFMSDYDGLTDGWFDPGWDVQAQADIMTYIASGPEDPILTGTGPWILTSMTGKSVTTADQFTLTANTGYYYYPRNKTTGDILETDPHPDIPGDPEWERPTKEGNWDPYGPYQDKLVYKVITQAPILIEALKDDVVDFSTSLDISRYVSELADAGFEFKRTDRMGYGHVSFHCHWNQGPQPTGKAKVRRAVAWAISKLDVIDKAFNGYAYSLEDPVPSAYPDPWNYEGPVSRKQANPAKARDLMQAAGYSDNDDDRWFDYKNGTDIELNFEITNIESIVNNIGDPIRKSIEAAGIKVDFQPVPWSTLINDLMAGAYDMTFFAFGLSYVPTILNLFWSKSALQAYYFRYGNSTYDQYYQQFMEGNRTEAQKAARKMQEILYWDQPQVPIYQNILLTAYDEDQYSGYINLYGAGITQTPEAHYYNALKLISGTPKGEQPPEITNVELSKGRLKGGKGSVAFNQTVNLSVRTTAQDPNTGGNVTDLSVTLNGSRLRGNFTYNAADRKLTIDTKPITLKRGVVTLVVLAKDNTGRITTKTYKVFLNIETNLFAPDLTINNPSAGKEVSGTVTVEGTASDADPDVYTGGTVSQVKVKVDNGNWTTATYNKASGEWSTQLDTTDWSTGKHTITIQVMDSGDPSLTTTKTVTVKVPKEKKPLTQQPMFLVGVSVVVTAIVVGGIVYAAMRRKLPPEE